MAQRISVALKNSMSVLGKFMVCIYRLIVFNIIPCPIACTNHRFPRKFHCILLVSFSRYVVTVVVCDSLRGFLRIWVFNYYSVHRHMYLSCRKLGDSSGANRQSFPINFSNESSSNLNTNLVHLHSTNCFNQ